MTKYWNNNNNDDKNKNNDNNSNNRVGYINQNFLKKVRKSFILLICVQMEGTGPTFWNTLSFLVISGRGYVSARLHPNFPKFSKGWPISFYLGTNKWNETLPHFF